MHESAVAAHARLRFLCNGERGEEAGIPQDMMRFASSILICILLACLGASLGAQSRQEETLARMRLQLALSRFQSENADYRCWARDFLGDRMLLGHLRMPEGVAPEDEEEDVSAALVEEVRFSGRKRLHYHRPSWIAWERRYYPHGGLLLVRSAYGKIRGIHADFLGGIPRVRPEARISCEELLQEGRPCWLFRQLFPGRDGAPGWQEDFLVEREGSRLLQWRRFDGQGRMRQCRIYLPYTDAKEPPSPLEIPPLDEPPVEAANFPEFQDAFLELLQKESRDLRSNRKIPEPATLLKAAFSPKNLRAIATNPRILAMLLVAAMATATPCLCARRRRRKRS